MMKNIFDNYFVWVFLLLLFSHCEQLSEVEVDIPFEGEKVVVYGMISDDGVARAEIWLTSNLDIDQEIPMLEGAIATIKNQRGEVFPLTFDKNIGYANIPVSENDTYVLSASYKDFSATSTEVVLPSKTTVLDDRADYSVDSTEVTIKINFQDNEEEENFYGYSIGKIENGVRYGYFGGVAVDSIVIDL